MDWASDQKALMAEVNKVTIQWLKDHPLNPDAYLNWLTNDAWILRVPWTYEDKD